MGLANHQLTVLEHKKPTPFLWLQMFFFLRGGDWQVPKAHRGSVWKWKCLDKWQEKIGYKLIDRWRVCFCRGTMKSTYQTICQIKAFNWEYWTVFQTPRKYYILVLLQFLWSLLIVTKQYNDYFFKNIDAVKTKAIPTLNSISKEGLTLQWNSDLYPIQPKNV